MTDTVAAPTDDDAGLLADVSTWLAEHWDPDLTVAQWWERVGAAGWSAPHFPRVGFTLLDGIPESLVLGIGLALGSSVSVAFLAAVFVSNIPEGIAGTSSLISEGHSRRQVYRMWIALVIASAAAAALGYAFARSVPSVDGRIVQSFAAGAMLTMLADTMMPEAFKHGGKIVGLLTTLGFLMAAILSVLE